jgi:hypothetical protein
LWRRESSTELAWAELQRRVLDDDEFSIDDLGRRRRLARMMRYAPLLSLPILAVVALALISNSLSLGVLLGSALILYGVVASYWRGSLWEARWSELIRLKESETGATADA